MVGTVMAQPRVLMLSALVAACLVFGVILNGRILGYQYETGLSYSTHSSIGQGHIPNQIWQIFYGFTPTNNKLQKSALSWMALNPTYSYTRIGRQGALDFVREHYADRPDIIRVYEAVQIPVLAADFLRYLLLAAEGGVYSDIDTTALRPVSRWIPDKLLANTTAIVGIEYDRRNDKQRLPGFMMDVQFCQWTIAAQKQHPMLQRVVDEVARAVQGLASHHGVGIEELQPTDQEVLSTTGPAIWSEVVYRSLSLATQTNVTATNVTGLKEPALFGDILVLPISGFAMGVPHSGGRSVSTKDALIKHGFKGSWRHRWWQW